MKLDHNFTYLNFENLIPNNLWGEYKNRFNKKKEIDFMHFKEQGHIILANKIFSLLQ